MKMCIKRNLKKTTTIALSFSLMGGMLLSMPGTAYAADANTTKEENVYATLNEDGSVQGIYVVNAYDLSADTNVIDYGSYTSVKNLTNENEIEESGNEISVEASKGKFYYQGDLDTQDLPWNIQIHYYLDGEEVSGSDLAGKSGALKIEIKLTQNENVDTSFFDNYLLQATIALPADQCTNIVAEGATIANMSGDKQILFNVMGGQEKTLTVTSDVTDFEMSAISFKGVPMSFDINLDDIDTSELTDKTMELSDGVTKLNDGAGELQDGTKQLQDGLSTYTSGVDSLYSGAATLAAGVDTLQSGTTTYTDAVSNLSTGSDTLAQKTENLPALMTNLSSAVSDLQSGSAKLADPDSGAAVQITAGLNEIEKGLQQMKAGLVSMNDDAITPMLTAFSTMETQMGALETGMTAANQYVAKLQEVDTAYQKEVQTLADIIGAIPTITSEAEDASATQSSEQRAGEPQTISSSETVTGEYAEDYTDTTTEQTTDADGNPVTVITNNVYMTRDNTTTITNDTTTNTETIITQTESVAETSNYSVDADTAQQLGLLYQDMAVNAGTLHVVLKGDGSQLNPGLTNVMTQCQAGVLAAKAALFTGTDSQPSMKAALTTLQIQLVGRDGNGGAVASVQEMIDGMEKIKYNVSGSENQLSLQNSLSSVSGGLTALNRNTSSLPAMGNELLSGISSLQAGVNTLNNNSSTLTSGVTSLKSGAGSLSSGANTLASNNDTLISGMSSLSDGMSTLKDGTQELSDQTSDMDDQIMDALEDKISNFTGRDYDGISFVSEENTNVDAVQFAIQTQDIKIAEVEEEEASQETSSFLDKLKALFTK